jgi:hypothetical protein
MGGWSGQGRAVGLLALATVLVVAPGCKRDAAPQSEGEDRTLDRLREEVDRAQRGEATGRAPGAAEAPHGDLAALAAKDDAPRPLLLPADNPTVNLGDLAVKVTSLTASHSVKAGKLELTSEDPFLAVGLVAQNVGPSPLAVDLSMAHVRSAGGNEFPIARDAQRGGTRQLDRAWEPGEREEVTLYFEVPARVLGHGLTLVLPAGAVAGARGDANLPLDEAR